MAFALSASLLALALSVSARPAEVPRAVGYTPVTPSTGLDPAIQRKLGPYAPWYPSGTYGAPPAGCALNQVNIVRICVAVLGCLGC